MKYSLVIPVYNEEANLPTLMDEIREAMDRLADPYEVIFIDDGSSDRSLEILKGLLPAHPMVRVIVFEQNAGQSAALDAGFKAARGEVLITLDADLQNDPRDIPLLLEEIGRCDAVVGWRALRRDNVVKRIASRIGNRVRDWVIRDGIADTGCSLKAFRREALRSLPVFKGMHRFLPALLRMQGCAVAQVKVSHRPRRHGATKYGVLDRLWATVPDLLAVRWMQSRVVRYRVKEEIPK